MKSSFKIAIIVGIVAVVIIASTALIVHSRLSVSEQSEIQSGAEQNENETPSQLANEIVNSLQNPPSSESGETNEGSESNEINEQTQTSSLDQIDISIIDFDGIYRWSTPSGINPTITLHANMTNPISFTNPTNTTHAFVIEQNGKQFLSTADITPGLSGKIALKPDITGVFEYHCKYHPDTMKGILNVVP
jgi:heme/copper-type cytochrome/quinol oxidase subunit 2